MRLNASGTVDATFNAGSGSTDEIEGITVLPTGKILINGYFFSYNGNPANGLARLNTDGSFDPTFAAALRTNEEAAQIAVQADGRILVAGGSYDNLLRLMPDGSLDNTFAYTPTAPYPNYIYSGFASPFALQSDGKILVLSAPINASTLPSLARLNPNGTVDATFQMGTGPNGNSRTVRVLANNNILVGGSFTSFNGVTDRQLLQLTSTGAVDPAFQPIFQNNGIAAAVVRQPDGKLVIGGSFYEVGGQVSRSMARLNVNGTLDATFSSSVGISTPVVDLALQPDGRIVAATRASVQRFLATGIPDNTFTAPSLTGSTLTRLLLQADGRILVGGSAYSLNGAPANTQGLFRLMPTGAPDNSFVLNTTGSGRLTAFQAMAQQPDGKLLVAGSAIPAGGTTAIRTLVRLESTGAIDASFTGSAFTSTSATLRSLAVQPDGNVLVGGSFTAYAGTARANIVRLNPGGTLDAGFVPPTSTGTIYSVLLQPNNRILLGGSFSSANLPSNLARLLSTGAADGTYAATATPNSTVNTLLVQPDGAIVAGGTFSSLSGAPSIAAARIVATNVLHAAAPKAVADRTLAWPVPAHGTLTVAPDGSSHPQALDLLDVLGRTVRHQPISGAAPATLALEGLPTGTYLLRVSYTEGAVTRRIQVQ